MNPRHPTSSGRICFLAWLCLACVLHAGVPCAEDALWPIDAPRRFTSTFGEPRPGRYHLGVDFSSGGVTGKAVYALGDGWISHVSTSPFGYGKLLEYTLDDGSVVRCGHLSGFLPAVEDRLDSLRARKHSYDVTFDPPSRLYRFGKGDVVAFSGDTGSGPTHLHLEYHDRSGAIVNPFLRGIAAADTVAPEIGDIVFIPLDRDSSVDGSPLPVRFDPERNGPPHLTGRVGVAARIVDRSEPGGFDLGVYRAELALDGVVVFSKEYGTIPAAGGRFGGLDYLAGWLYGNGGVFSALFRREGNSLGFFSGAGLPKAGSDASPVYRALRITVHDYAGNTMSRDAGAVFGARPVITACAFDSSGVLRIAGSYPGGSLDRVELFALRNGGWTPLRTVRVRGRTCSVTESFGEHPAAVRVYLAGRDGFRSLPVAVRFEGGKKGESPTRLSAGVTMCHDRAAVRIASDRIPDSLPVFHAERGDGAGIQVPVTPLGDTLWIASVPLEPGKNVIRFDVRALDSRLRPVAATAKIDAMLIDPGKDFSVFAPDGRFSVRVFPESLYRAAPVSVECAEPSEPERLISASPVYRVAWGDEPLKGSCRVAFTLDHEPSLREHVYVSGNGKEWRCISGRRQGATLTAEYAGSGFLGVFVDETAPEVAPLAPSEAGKTSRRPGIRFRVIDRESGIGGSAAIIMLLDGEPVYGEYDPEGDTVSYTPRRDLPPGAHKVDVHVADRAGNRSFASRAFTVR